MTNSRAICDYFVNISTHTPLAGRDVKGEHDFLNFRISTHTPLAGRDFRYFGSGEYGSISTHTPLAGRDDFELVKIGTFDDFYSHAPRGA